MHPDARLLARMVVLKIGDEGAEQRAAHHRELAGDGVEEPDRVRLASKVSFPNRLDEAEVDDFLIVAGRQALAHHVQRTARLGHRAHPRP